MAETTKIEWCDCTFNPWVGCSKCSPGCDNCYAERDFDKRRHFAAWGPGQERRKTSESYWKQPLKWNRECAESGVSKTVFCGSLCDVFDEEVRNIRRHPLLNLIQKTPRLTWLLLTKRPENMRKFFRECGPPHMNIWLGVTVCDQREADQNITALLNTPAAGRFVSIEPMLGPVDLRNYLCKGWSSGWPVTDPYLDWVIVGGETGPKARPMFAEWVWPIYFSCQDAKTPFFLKQWGEYDRDGVRVGKQKAGCLLDGREHKEFPVILKPLPAEAGGPITVTDELGRKMIYQ